MATTSKKKIADRTIDTAKQRIKDGVTYAATEAKKATHNVIDLTRRTKRRATNTAKKALDVSGQIMESTGESIKRSGRKVKRAA